MMHMVKIQVLGTIQPKDAESRFTPDGTPVLSFRMVANKKTKNRQTGEYEDHADWFQVTYFGQQAEKLAHRMVKGANVLVHGTFSSREWQAQDGSTRTALEIRASDIVDLMPRKEWGETEAPAREGGSDDLNDLPF